MLDAFLPDKDDNLLQPLNSETPKDLLSTSHPFQNPLNPGFGEQIKAFDNPVADFTGDLLWESVIDLDQTQLDANLVDLLTGEALQNFAADPDFDDKISLAFGENWNREVVKDLQQDWLSGDFSDIPQVQILSSDVLPAANGAYSSETDTIYLSREFLMENADNPAAIADVLLEEYGHAIDAKINAVDSAGDEGEILSSVVQGEVLSEGELLALKVEDDSGMITLDGEEIAIEKSFWRLGTFIGPRTFLDFVGNSDPEDYYQFSLNSTQRFDISLTGLQADADIELVQSQGFIDISLASSTNGGTNGEFISRTLNPGTYGIRVYRYGSANTNYTLNLSSTPLFTPLPPPPTKPDLNIQLVRGSGFKNSEWQKILVAEQNWENIITNDRYFSHEYRSGDLKILVTKEPLYGNESGWRAGTYDGPAERDVDNPDVDRGGVDYDNIIQFNSRNFQDTVNRNLLVRVATHEIGNTLGLTDDNSYSNLMNHFTFSPNMGNNFDRLTNIGYGVNRNAYIRWT